MKTIYNVIKSTITCIFLFLSFTINAVEAQEFHFSRATMLCQNSLGQLGLNSAYIGECGDLRELDLSGRDLSNTNFIGANLRGANLAKSLLQGANLSYADLTDANVFQGAKLQGAFYNDKTKFSEGIDPAKLGLVVYNFNQLDLKLLEAIKVVLNTSSNDLSSIAKLTSQNASIPESHCRSTGELIIMNNRVDVLTALLKPVRMMSAKCLTELLEQTIRNDRASLFATLVTNGASFTNDDYGLNLPLIRGCYTESCVRELVRLGATSVIPEAAVQDPVRRNAVRLLGAVNAAIQLGASAKTDKEWDQKLYKWAKYKPLPNSADEAAYNEILNRLVLVGMRTEDSIYYKDPLCQAETPQAVRFFLSKGVSPNKVCSEKNYSQQIGMAAFFINYRLDSRMIEAFYSSGVKPDFKLNYTPKLTKFLKEQIDGQNLNQKRNYQDPLPVSTFSQRQLSDTFGYYSGTLSSFVFEGSAIVKGMLDKIDQYKDEKKPSVKLIEPVVPKKEYDSVIKETNLTFDFYQKKEIKDYQDIRVLSSSEVLVVRLLSSGAREYVRLNLKNGATTETILFSESQPIGQSAKILGQWGGKVQVIRNLTENSIDYLTIDEKGNTAAQPIDETLEQIRFDPFTKILTGVYNILYTGGSNSVASTQIRVFDLTDGPKEIEQIKMYSIDSNSFYSVFPYGHKIYVGYRPSISVSPQEFSLTTYDLNTRKEENFLTIRNSKNGYDGFNFQFDTIIPLASGEISLVTVQGRRTVDCKKNEVCITSNY